MRAPWEWNEDDVLELIANAVGENVNLDYKGCDALQKSESRKTEISKDVSAFANSGGGTIVYGVVEDRTTHLPQAIDVGYDPAAINEEWLEQVINSSIQRRIEGIRINRVALPKTQPGKVLYVVSIPQNNRAPHMASDHRYYKRFNFQSVRMEEYEVRDVARRDEAPNLRLIISLYTEMNPSVTHVAPDGSRATFLDGTRRANIAVTMVNDSSQPAQHVLIRLFLDARLKFRESGFNKLGTAEWTVRKQLVSGDMLQLNWESPPKTPIWDGLAAFIANLYIEYPDQDGTYVIGWRLDSPGMRYREGACLLDLVGNSVSVEQLTGGQVPVPPYLL